MENIKYLKPTPKEKLKNKIMDESLSELIKLNDYCKAKRNRIEHLKHMNDMKRLQNQNVYHHEYNRIKNYLDTTVIDPVEAGRLLERQKQSKAVGSERQKSKYDELLNGK